MTPAEQDHWRERILEELARCSLDPAWFIDRWCRIYDSEEKEWIDFRLWPAQREVCKLTEESQLIAALKARQLGLTWFYLGYILQGMIFRPVAKPLIFSRREEDAIYLLGDERLRGMYKQLPSWMLKALQAETVTSAARSWSLANGSTAHCFPINAGDSYTATFALMDEFDLLSTQEQARLLRSVKPTIDAGGKLVLLSRSDKAKPESEFKNIYRAAKRGESSWKSIFLPWHARPGRDQAWYERQKNDVLSTTGFLDALHEQYPATDAEALAPAAANKRIPAEWLLNCFEERKPLKLPREAPSIPGLEIFVLPEVFHEYVVGGDPAQGNPSGDPSAISVLDLKTGEEVALVVGRIQPDLFARYMNELAEWYNRASLCVERNNHGWAVLQWLEEHGTVRVLNGTDGKPGWLTTKASKATMYSTATEALREGDTTIHSMRTFTELSSIEGATLEAPQGQHDDIAVSFALGLQARVLDQAWYEPGCLTS